MSRDQEALGPRIADVILTELRTSPTRRVVVARLARRLRSAVTGTRRRTVLDRSVGGLAAWRRPPNRSLSMTLPRTPCPMSSPSALSSRRVHRRRDRSLRAPAGARPPAVPPRQDPACGQSGRRRARHVRILELVARPVLDCLLYTSD